MCPINHSYIQYSMKIEYIFHRAKYISQNLWLSSNTVCLPFTHLNETF